MFAVKGEFEFLMQVVFHENFYEVYSPDPASKEGRMESIVEVIRPFVDFVDATPASETDITEVHSTAHVDNVREIGLYNIAALAAGGAVRAAELGLDAPTFGLIRPPGHHASADSSWGFCYFNNMAIALESLKKNKKIRTAYVLDIDLHYGDGTVNILGSSDYVTISNAENRNRNRYMEQVMREMAHLQVDIIGISAGFDNHKLDWGGVLETSDYHDIGHAVRTAVRRTNCGSFAILEGGYNHQILGQNVLALIRGLSGK